MSKREEGEMLEEECKRKELPAAEVARKWWNLTAMDSAERAGHQLFLQSALVSTVFTTTQ